jgi:PAS domain S-box-containing protein
MRLSVRTKIILGFVINIIVVVIFGLISNERINNLKKVAVYGNLEDHEERVGISSGKILGGINNLNNTSKGYFITGDQRYIDQFNETIYLLEINSEQLKNLYNNNSQQLQKISNLKKLIEEKIKNDYEIIDLKKIEGREKEKGAVTIAEDLIITNKIVTNVLSIQAEEARLLYIAKAKVDLFEKRLEIIFNLLLGSSILMLIIVFFIIQYYMKAKSEAENLKIEEKKLLQSVVDNTSNAIFVRKINGEYLLINKEYEKLINKSIDTKSAKPNDNESSAEIPDPFLESDIDVVKSGKEIKGEKTLISEDVIHTYSIVKFPLFDSANRIYAVVGIATDITESKNFENLLKESEEKYRLLVDSIRDYAIFSIDPEGYIKTWNKGAEYIKGYMANEIIGKHISVFYTPEELERGESGANLRAAKENGRFEGEGWRVRKNGTRFWANIILTALYNQAGELKGYANVSRDISERRRTEEKLRQSEEQLQIIFDSAPDALIVIDDEGNIIRWNPKAEKLFGWTLAEVIGKPMHTIIMPERYRERHIRGLQHFLTSGEGPIINKTIELTAINKKNIEFEIELTVSPASIRDKYIFIGFLKDISARKLMEKQIRESGQFLDSIIQNIPNMIFVKEAKNLSFVRINKGGEKLLGLSETELKGKTDYDFFPKEQADFFIKKDRDVLEKDILIDIPEEPIDTKNGRRWLHTQKIPIKDENNNPVYLLGISQDITEPRKLEKQKNEAERLVRENEQRMKLILENIGEGVIVADRKERIILSNHMAEEIIGISEDSGTSKNIDFSSKYELYYPDDETIFPAQNLPLEKALKGESTDDVEIIIEDPEAKTKKRVIMNGRPIKDDNNNIIAAVSTIKDITRYKKLESALEESEQKYRKLIGFSRDK